MSTFSIKCVFYFSVPSEPQYTPFVYEMDADVQHVHNTLPSPQPFHVDPSITPNQPFHVDPNLGT